ncbi:Programmed cell death protein 10 like [Schistosoma japonicum]|nr:Programmed cell death protein 10 like [Schistosoma japonicum]
MAGSKWPASVAPTSRVGNTPRAKQVIFEPTFAKMEKENYSLTQRLKEAFYKRYPGFSKDFMVGLLQRMGVDSEIDVTETCLRIAALQECDNPRTSRNPRVLELELTAKTLKTILSSIPDEITDRRAFIEVIKGIADAIKMLLAAVGAFYDALPPGTQKKCLEDQKRKFITYCRKFSDTLKQYFRNNELV